MSNNNNELYLQDYLNNNNENNNLPDFQDLPINFQPLESDFEIDYDEFVLPPEMVIPDFTSEPQFQQTHFEIGSDFSGFVPILSNSSTDHHINSGSTGTGDHEHLIVVDDVNHDNSDDVTKVTGSSSSDVDGRKRKKSKSGLPAKNLLAERRRRTRLNEGLLQLRSVVPNISKMDRASILGDAITYVKDLSEKISGVNLELESLELQPVQPAVIPATANGLYHQTATAATVPTFIREEPAPVPTTIEVNQIIEGVLKIHMFCNQKPGLMYSVTSALDKLGLDIKQAVMSSFDGFALDVFRAELFNGGQDVNLDNVKQMLLKSAGNLAIE